MLDFGMWGEIAKLGIGTMMALGMIYVVFYLLKYTIPEIRKAHVDDVSSLRETHLKDVISLHGQFNSTMQLVVDEARRSNDAICSRLEKAEEGRDRHTEALSSILTLLHAR